MVKWTAHAKSQVRHIHDYIAQDSLLYARRVSEELIKKTIGLDALPRNRIDSVIDRPRCRREPADITDARAVACHLV